ncbi:MAG: hypothetical protein H6733_09690 [Alphaproteobacteria bacterium]|nr:hypothetical protein [Alphaproteobacteria bacterium]
MSHRPLFAVVAASLSVLSGCYDGPREGIAVGNPGQGVTLRIQPQSDVTALSSMVHLAAVSAIGCDGSVTALYGPVAASAVGGTPLDLPGTTLCGLRLELAEPLVVEGSSADGTTFSLALDVDRVDVSATMGFTTTAHPLVFMLGPDGWLSAEALGLTGGGHVVLGADDAKLLPVAADVATKSELCLDLDGDGRLGQGDQIVARGEGTFEE